MEFEIQLNDMEVSAIIAKHIEVSVFGNLANGRTVLADKKISVRARGYGGLSAVVNIDDAPVDESKKD